MGGSGTVIPARMSLSVRPEQSQIECAFSYNGKELSRRPTRHCPTRSDSKHTGTTLIPRPPDIR